MSGIGSNNGWLEAAIAWEVCASLHRQYCKGKDGLFTTWQSDFVKHAENARRLASHGQAPAEFSQFLSDVMTAAGLVTHGKQCKDLGVRLGDMCSRLRADQVLAMGRESLPSIASVEMVDAAMVEMRNIVPPLRRSECRQLIDAALSAAHGIKQGGQHGTDT